MKTTTINDVSLYFIVFAFIMDFFFINITDGQFNIWILLTLLLIAKTLNDKN